MDWYFCAYGDWTHNNLKTICLKAKVIQFAATSNYKAKHICSREKKSNKI